MMMPTDGTNCLTLVYTECAKNKIYFALILLKVFSQTSKQRVYIDINKSKLLKSKQEDETCKTVTLL